jgi:phage tail-like protein
MPYPPINYFPPAAFSFTLGFSGISGSGNDTAFQEVSGLTATQETVEIKEGGQNMFAHKAPGRMKYEDLTLKRGLMLWDSLLSKWCLAQLGDGLRKSIVPKDVILTLYEGRKGQPLMTWNFKNAYPIKWGVSDMDASKSAFVVETLVLTYNYYTIKNIIKHNYLFK